jgi:uncharacterized membrane protein
MACVRRTAGRFSGSMISRKMIFSALVSALAIAAFATESQAADWTGCHGAVAAGSSTFADPLAGPAEPEAGDGAQIGVAAGCDYHSIPSRSGLSSATTGKPLMTGLLITTRPH